MVSTVAYIFKCGLFLTLPSEKLNLQREIPSHICMHASLVTTLKERFNLESIIPMLIFPSAKDLGFRIYD